MGRKENGSKVYVRIRPTTSGDPTTRVDHKKISLEYEDDVKNFNFDGILNIDDGQQETYDLTCKPLVDHVVDGFNATLLAYGQTSSGKTYTMLGPGSIKTMAEVEYGMILRVATDLFDRLVSRDDLAGYTVKVSYLEIFMNKIRDLTTLNGKDLNIRDNGKANGVMVEGLRSLTIESAADLMALVNMGHKRRASAATLMNDRSSRSHAVLIITLSQTRKPDTETGVVDRYKSQFCLVDLAGSENANRTGATGNLLKQASSINTSLTTLANVIRAVTTKQAHTPYRDSKLTHLLKNSLGGNAWMSLIICVSADKVNGHQTLSSLRFGESAKKMKNQPKKVLTMNKGDWRRLAETLEKELKMQKTANKDLIEKLKELKALAEDNEVPAAIEVPEVKSRNRRLSSVVVDDDEDDGESVEMTCAPEFVRIENVPIDNDDDVAVSSLMNEVSVLSDELKRTREAVIEKNHENMSLVEELSLLKDIMLKHDVNMTQAFLSHVDVDPFAERTPVIENSVSADFGVPDDTDNSIIFWVGMLLIVVVLVTFVILGVRGKQNLPNGVIITGVVVSLVGLIMVILGLAQVA